MYHGEVPLAIHLKSYFKMNKKYGSKDRKLISHLCYCHYRTGNLLKKETREDRVVKSLFLCSAENNSLLLELKKEYNEAVQLPLLEKLSLLNVKDADLIFPFRELLGMGIEKEAFLANQLQQPYLYIRIRPKYLANILIRLKTIAVACTIMDPYTIRLPNGFPVEAHFELDQEVVIQDYSSQLVFNGLLAVLQKKHHYKVWDCCAASGGKSILLHDLYPGKLDLFVTDIRTTILENLEKRFYSAGIFNYKITEADIAKKPLPVTDLFDIIICDVPCSGSGTWARTPEQTGIYKVKKTAEYAAVQSSIAKHAFKNLKPGGYFVYITCSVFAAENEELVAGLLKETSLSLVSQNYLKGYEHGADTMFVALLQHRI
jgi:16S rRNA (cytosine967-C5)-methyltransferase